MLRALGTGPGFAGFAYLALLGIVALAWNGVPVEPLTGPLGVVAAAYFGGGWLKRREEMKGANHRKVD